MIESIMYFGIGFLSAALSVLVVVPLVHGRAVRLTTRRLEGAIPSSVTETLAHKDLLRADFAITTRRLEMNIEQFKTKNAGLKAKLKGRNAKRPRSCPSAAGAQLLPPSVDTSTVRMPYPPSQAMPPTLTVEPGVYPCSVFMASDQRVHHHFRDRCVGRCVLLPERNAFAVRSSVELHGRQSRFSASGQAESAVPRVCAGSGERLHELEP